MGGSPPIFTNRGHYWSILAMTKIIGLSPLGGGCSICSDGLLSSFLISAAIDFTGWKRD